MVESLVNFCVPVLVLIGIIVPKTFNFSFWFLVLFTKIEIDVKRVVLVLELKQHCLRSIYILIIILILLYYICLQI